MGQRRVHLSLSLAEASVLLTAIMHGTENMVTDPQDYGEHELERLDRTIDRYKMAYWGARHAEGWVPQCELCGVRETTGAKHDYAKHDAYNRRHGRREEEPYL